MDKTILSIGLVIIVVGLFLVIGFWPIFGVSGSELVDDRDDLQYESYDEGDEVLVYGTITGIEEPPDRLEGLGVHVEIDDELNLVLTEVNSTDFEEGDDVYAKLTLQEETFIVSFQYWEIEGNLNSKTLVDFSFYSVTGAGVALAAVSTIKD